MDGKIPFCNEPVQLNPSGPPPSIVFIIDNSGSMNESDPDNSRFAVVSSLLDDIKLAAPSTEVGLVIFTRRLAFDHRDNPLFKTMFPGDTSQHDAYVPLTPLNKIFPGGLTGLDTLKALVKHDSNGNLVYNTLRPASRNNSAIGRANTRDGTDITLGFQAARQALKDSRADRSQQFFIFLSDGVPSTPDIGREALINDFITNVSGVPATFTVFFDTEHSLAVAPGTIVAMTNNIKVSGYSATNPRSAFWAIHQPGLELEKILKRQVLGNIIFLPSQPKSATLSLGETNLTSIGMDSAQFLFARPLPLQPNTTQMLLNYANTYIDTTGGQPVAKDMLVPYIVNIQRMPGSSVPKGAVETCREQGELSLYHAGRKVSIVNADYSDLEARLTLPAGQACPSCRVEITSVSPSIGVSVADHESFFLQPTDDYFYAPFQREISLTPWPGDGKLQHLPLDSIALTYTNPLNPLDVLSRRFGYVDIATVLNLTGHNAVAHACEHLPPVSVSHWFLVGTPGLQPQGPGAIGTPVLAAPLTPADSARFVGVLVEASRAFKVDVSVFSNLGEFVNRLRLTLPPDEFDKLEKTENGARRLRILWDNRDVKGALAGTGAYVMKTTLTLLKIPGVSENEVVRTDARVVGVLHAP